MAAEGEQEESAYPLHECVFRGDVAALSALIRGRTAAGTGGAADKAGLLGAQDVHGNTALHLAVMLGRRELVHLLLAHGAPVKVKNKLGWSPLSEAIR